MNREAVCSFKNSKYPAKILSRWSDVRVSQKHDRDCTALTQTIRGLTLSCPPSFSPNIKSFLHVPFVFQNKYKLDSITFIFILYIDEIFITHGNKICGRILDISNRFLISQCSFTEKLLKTMTLQMIEIRREIPD